MLPSTITPHPTYLLGKGTGLMAFYNRKIYSNTSILGTINQVSMNSLYHVLRDMFCLLTAGRVLISVTSSTKLLARP